MLTPHAVHGAGMFMRACQATSAKSVALPELLGDVAELRRALEGELGAIAAAAAPGPGGGAGGWGGNALWLGADEAEAAATALQPKLASARKATQALLFEVVALEVSCCCCLLHACFSS